jgi:hypothetical protein
VKFLAADLELTWSNGSTIFPQRSATGGCGNGKSKNLLRNDYKRVKRAIRR